MASFTGEHGPEALRVSVTVPEEISAAEGVYVAVSNAALSNVPVPEVVHTEEVALPPIEPESRYVLPEQMIASAPPFTVPADCDVTVAFAVIAAHAEAVSETETVYVPPGAVIDCVVEPVLQEYEYGGEPPEAFAVNIGLGSPVQITGLDGVIETVSGVTMYTLCVSQ